MLKEIRLDIKHASKLSICTNMSIFLLVPFLLFTYMVE